MKKLSKFIGTFAIMGLAVSAAPVQAAKMIGYWEGWNGLALGSVSSNYDIVDCAFATLGGTDNATVSWSQSESTTQFKSDIQTIQNRGGKVIMSIGGANSNKLQLLNSTDVNSFVNSVEGLVSTYGFNGIDFDLEQGDFDLQGGDTNLTSPTTHTIKNVISAIGQLESHYGSSFIISYAPQTLDICAYGQYDGGYGDYLPVLYACRGDNQLVGIQCYNSGGIYSCTGGSVNEGTPDFPVAGAELLLHGYTMGNGQAFPAMSQSQVAFGIPATSGAAGSGYLSPSQVLQAAKYLGSGTSYGGAYHLAGGPYGSFAGVMTWDVNYDNESGWAMADTLVSYLHSIGGSGSSGPIANGTYTLTPQNATGSRLDNTGSATTNGNRVQIWAASGGSAQNWVVTNEGGSVYKIQPAAATGLCLDVSGAGTTNKTPVDIWADNGTSAQRWTISGSSPYNLIPSCASGEVLGVSGAGTSNGTLIDLYQPNGTTGEEWVFTKS